MKFQLTIDLGNAAMQDHHDVAKALRSVADHISKFVSTGWNPYALSASIKDENGNTVGRWEVKGDFEWNPTVEQMKPDPIGTQPERPSAIKPYAKLERKPDGRGPLVGRKKRSPAP
jgi:hypothetical protein